MGGRKEHLFHLGSGKKDGGSTSPTRGITTLSSNSEEGESCGEGPGVWKEEGERAVLV